MAKLYNLGVINRTTLAVAITGASTTMQVAAGDGAIFESPPFLLVLTPDLSIPSLDVAEYVEIDAISTDVLTFGTRDLYSQATTQIHGIGTMIAETWQPKHVTHLQDCIKDLQFALGHQIGHLGTGVKVWGTGFSQMKVVQQGTPDMTVKVNLGFGFRDYIMGRLIADFNTATIVAPSSDPRKDLVSFDTVFNKIIVTTGVEAASPVIPSTLAGHFALAEIDVIVSQSSIVTGDITDVRVTL